MTVEPGGPAPVTDPAYADGLLDWLACAVAGGGERAAAAARGAGDPILAAGAAGHVLDFDDTYLPGLAHLSAPTAPVAVVLGGRLGASVGEALAAYAAGFEAMAAVTAASHPALYTRGFHPTAVGGVVGAAVTAARLLGLKPEREHSAVAVALLAAGGLRAAFGSDGKALQVGMAATAGARGAQVAAAGAVVPLARVTHGDGGWEDAYGGRFAPPGDEPAVADNWIKAYPCCLQAHSSIEAADLARAAGVAPDGTVEVTVHPVSLQAASLGDPADGLEAKFSIPYLTAYTLRYGPPDLTSFARVDPAARGAVRRVRVRAHADLLESEARLEVDGEEVARVEAALGSPRRPLAPAQLARKVRGLAGDRLDGALADPARPARDLAEAAGLA
jgi:2-methylcitrate dehydratase PrpD